MTNRKAISLYCKYLCPQSGIELRWKFGVLISVQCCILEYSAYICTGGWSYTLFVRGGNAKHSYHPASFSSSKHRLHWVNMMNEFFVPNSISQYISGHSLQQKLLSQFFPNSNAQQHPTTVHRRYLTVIALAMGVRVATLALHSTGSTRYSFLPSLQMIIFLSRMVLVDRAEQEGEMSNIYDVVHTLLVPKSRSPLQKQHLSWQRLPQWW